MKIGVMGSGMVGQVLGAGLVAAGHEVCMGSRSPEKCAAWVSRTGPGAGAGTFAEAAAFGDTVVLATLGAATQDALKLADPKNFSDKVVIDTTNPLDFSAGLPRLFVGMTDSLGEQVQRLLPSAKVVKAFNTVGNAHMVHPKFPGGPPDMFICGDDEGAKLLVTELCRELGWPTLDFGGIERSRELEPLCLLWVHYGMKSNSWGHAFKLLRK